MGNCVTVARQTLTLFVGVRIPIPQPKRALNFYNSRLNLRRGVAQFGGALRSGRRGRWFESSHLDHFFKYADAAKLSDAQDLGSCGAIRAGSSPVIRRLNKDGSNLGFLPLNNIIKDYGII